MRTEGAEVWPVTPEEDPKADFSPLAPVIYGEDPEPEPVADEAEADGGVSDSENIVRVWLEEGRLTRVRISPVWYTRLGRRSLDDCLNQALRLAGATVGEVRERELPDFSNFDFSSLPEFGARSFSAIQHLFDDVEQRWDAALERNEEQEPEPVVPVEGTSKGVTVLLDASGRAHTVDFDDKWLRAQQVGTICDNVVLAAQKAYARYVPPADDTQELDALEDEHRFLMAALKAMLNPKERR